MDGVAARCRVALVICVHIVVSLEAARRDRDFCDALARLAR
jgi:hypothetical protein